MATRTKEEFEQLGYTHASNGDVRSYKSDSTSWQGLAYNAGVRRRERELAFKALMARPTGKSVAPVFYTPKPTDKFTMALTGEPVKIWFDELQHNTPANRWSTEPGFEGWPVGAVAHVKNLVEQLKTETDIKREVRLLNALTRLKRRHGVRA